MQNSHFKVWMRRIHLWIGLSSGLIVFIVGLTGAMYAFEKEIRDLLHHDLYTAENLAGRALPLDTVLQKVAAANKKQKIKQVLLPAGNRTIQVNLKNRNSVFVHPTTGKIVGNINQETEVLAVILKIHRQLYLGEVGKKITGISCLVFFISVLSGLILWWPSKRNQLAQRLKIVASKGKKRLNFDLHRSLGFYASFVLIILALTGLVFSFKWMEKTLYLATGTVKKEKKYFSDTLHFGQSASFESLLAHIKNQYPGKTIFMALPEDKKSAIRISVQLGAEGLFTASSHYFYDQFTGKELGHVLYEEQSLGEKLRASNLNFHTGKVFGFFGECLVFLAGLIAASLPLTGFIIWNNKRKKNRVALN